VVAAAPVIAPEAFGELKGVAAEVVAVIVPETLQSVSEWYGNFSPTTDEEVRLLLDACAPHK
jgi:predicted phosphoribosyltransferase